MSGQLQGRLKTYAMSASGRTHVTIPMSDLQIIRACLANEALEQIKAIRFVADDLSLDFDWLEESFRKYRRSRSPAVLPDHLDDPQTRMKHDV